MHWPAGAAVSRRWHNIARLAVSRALQRARQLRGLQAGRAAAHSPLRCLYLRCLLQLLPELCNLGIALLQLLLLPLCGQPQGLKTPGKLLHIDTTVQLLARLLTACRPPLLLLLLLRPRPAQDGGRRIGKGHSCSPPAHGSCCCGGSLLVRTGSQALPAARPWLPPIGGRQHLLRASAA